MDIANITNIATTILYFMIVLSVLVLVHEIGHFIAARRAGVRVEEFGLGYPPRAVRLFKRGDTDYTLNWLPLGGFVRMTGEENPSDPKSFAAAKAWKRAVILSAGAGMNVVLAIVLFMVIALMGVPRTVEFVNVASVAPGSPAEMAGLQAGDRIMSIDGQPVVNRMDVSRAAIERAGQPVSIDVKRAKDNLTVYLTPRVHPPKNEGRMGITMTLQFVREETVSYSPLDALVYGFNETISTGTQIFTGFRRMADGTAPAEVGGPVQIAGFAGLFCGRNLQSCMQFTALLSVNLAIINMLPFPALDGGRLVFVVLEVLRRGKRVKPELEGVVHFVGMAILLLLMLVITVFDVQRLLPGG
ncbi:MAG: RIP metalloprotease RseP [Chloroflexi bacterium]|nr:RIP metalloprotease RseP [Chloroflexota bacterium]